MMMTKIWPLTFNGIFVNILMKLSHIKVHILSPSSKPACMIGPYLSTLTSFLTHYQQHPVLGTGQQNLTQHDRRVGIEGLFRKVLYTFGQGKVGVRKRTFLLSLVLQELSQVYPYNFYSCRFCCAIYEWSDTCGYLSSDVVCVMRLIADWVSWVDTLERSIQIQIQQNEALSIFAACHYRSWVYKGAGGNE